METELKAIFESLDQTVFTDDLKTAISTVISEAVDKKVQDRVDLELKQMDESHADKTKVLVERLEETFNDYRTQVDEDHCQKMLQVKNTLEESYGAKLLIVKEAYEGVIKKEAVQHRDQLVEAVNSFLDTYLEKTVPVEDIKQAAKNKYVQEQLDAIRRVAGIDKSVMSENVRRGIIQGKTQMDKLVKENAELKKLKAHAESKRVLAEKTAVLPVEQARFVRSRLEGKSADFIESNFSYVLEMFGKAEKQSKASLLSERQTYIVDRAKIEADETTKNEVLAESTDPLMGMYLQGMNFRK